ncbi:MAG: histidine phosphatase family protein [Bacilli bacterium]|jgi:broad specificity phosphatase PhoE
MKRIYLMRHGRTVFNDEHIVQGYSSDSPLTEDAKNKAKKVYKYFLDNHIKFDNVYSSDTIRASTTARLVTNNEYKINEVRDLREMKFGTEEKMKKHYSFYRLLSYHGGFKNVGGDTNKEASDRLYKTLLDLITKEENNTILCVSSCAIILNFIKFNDPVFYKVLYKKKHYPNFSTLILEYNDGKFKVIEHIEFPK